MISSATPWSLTLYVAAVICLLTVVIPFKLRALTVLQRDLAREEQRIRAEEEAAAAAIPKPPSPGPTTDATPAGSPTQTQSELLPEGSLRPRLTGVGINVARRQSTISLSSLSRPALQHHLSNNTYECQLPSCIQSQQRPNYFG